MNAERAAERRADARKTVVWPARMLHGRINYACVLYDLSAGGAKLRFDRKLSLTAGPVLISCSKIGELWADIVYARGNILGVRFQADREEVAALLSHANRAYRFAAHKPKVGRPRVRP